MDGPQQPMGQSERMQGGPPAACAGHGSPSRATSWKCLLSPAVFRLYSSRQIYIWDRAGVQPESELACGPNRKVLPFAESVSVQEFIDCQSGSILRVGR